MNRISLENVHENPRFANLIACLQEVSDFRSDKNKIYGLECIIIMAICAILGGANNCTEIADFIANRSEYYMPLFNINVSLIIKYSRFLLKTAFTTLIRSLVVAESCLTIREIVFPPTPAS